VLLTALALCLLAGPVLARSPDSGPQAPKAEDLTTGSIDASTREKKQKQFDDCMAIWDKGTHMTKKQWRRTCSNTLEELPDL
jgi:hypothetical protein